MAIKTLENLKKLQKKYKNTNKVLVMAFHGLPKGGSPPLVSSYLAITNTFVFILYLFCTFSVFLYLFCIFSVLFLYFDFGRFSDRTFSGLFLYFFKIRESYLFCIFSYFNLFRKNGPGRGYPFLYTGVNSGDRMSLVWHH